MATRNARKGKEKMGDFMQGSRAVIYARFSSDKQTDASIAAQERACRDYAATHGLTVLRVYADEAISGKGSKTLLRQQY